MFPDFRSRWGHAFSRTVTVGFEVAAGDDSALIRRSMKRKFAEMANGNATTKRHLCWIQRHLKSTKTGSWRPVKMHRVKARRWLYNIDHQIRRSTRWVGIKSFIRPTKDIKYPWRDQDWRIWPSLHGALDEGSDGISACQALFFFNSVAASLCIRIQAMASTTTSVEYSMPWG